MGLATGPQVLLAKQVEAQAVYDLEDAKSTVHDAEAGLRQTVGVPADTDIRIESGELDQMPKGLGDDVEILMIDALKQRPDLAAQAAKVQAADASIARARSEFYPEIEVSGSYGQAIWSYTVNGGSTQNLNQPFYSALMTLKWDLFTGFDRYFGVQSAAASGTRPGQNLGRSELMQSQRFGRPTTTTPRQKRNAMLLKHCLLHRRHHTQPITKAIGTAWRQSLT